MVMYIAACILKGETFFKITDVSAYAEAYIVDSRYSKLSYIRRMDLKAYGYLVEAVRLLGE